MSVLNNVEPKEVFGFFEEISQIPHGSYNTKEISDYLKKFAEDRNLECYQDDVNNIIIIKEATEGYEEVDPIIIQGHMDMVCQKGAGVDFDFEKDSLKLFIDGDFLKAEGTTLGGDDGIAVAMAMAVLDSKTLKHPRIEAVITVDEEVGLLGAEAIDVSMLKAKKFINIDSEEEGIFTVSCAGGVSVTNTIPFKREKLNGELIKITISDLKGGHSGISINLERANANILMGRVLRRIYEECTLNIVNIEGGQRDNVICNYASADIIVDKSDAEKVKDIIKEFQSCISHEFSVSDPKIKIEGSVHGEETVYAVDKNGTRDIISYAMMTPQGVQHMSSDIEGLVETSLNLGVLKTEEAELNAVYAVRSSVSTRKDNLVDKLTVLAEMFGGKTVLQGAYPGWEYKQDSPLRDKAVRVFTEMYGREPKIEAIHAGLECGLFAGKIGEELDCISIGPDMFGVHTPKERLSISSTKRVWEFLIKLIEEK